jgi:1-acyl-sn-glycerol-3-phosphate acyltransferase
MAPTNAAGRSYDALLGVGGDIFPGLRIGRPGRARSYRATVTAMRALRVLWKIEVEGAEHVAPGSAILIANHVAAADPMVVVMGTGWRVTAFTKVEWFEGRAAPFFRLMGQIPLRRGNPASTDWAIDLATAALEYGGKIGLYPEGTRSPDPTKLHRLHGRILLPVLHANPEVPVHAVTTAYTRRPRRRTLVQVRVSPRLSLDRAGTEPDAIITVIRDALLRLGGQTYVDVSAHDVKRGRDGGLRG